MPGGPAAEARGLPAVARCGTRVTALRRLMLLHAPLPVQKEFLLLFVAIVPVVLDSLFKVRPRVMQGGRPMQCGPGGPRQGRHGDERRAAWRLQLLRRGAAACCTLPLLDVPHNATPFSI